MNSLDPADALAMVAAVRELHKPLNYKPGWDLLDCEGCDPGSHAEGYAAWPCSTADIVYTPEEIRAAQRGELT